MDRDPRAFLLDIIDCGGDPKFASGKSEAAFLSDEVLQAALERKLQIVGEAISKLRKLSPELAARLPRFKDAAAMRNRLVHGYRDVDAKIVWASVRDDLPVMMGIARELIDELGWD